MKNNIRIERARIKMTQAELAAQIGVSRQSINAIEGEKYVPSTALALKMAALFKMPVENLFELEPTD